MTHGVYCVSETSLFKSVLFKLLQPGLQKYSWRQGDDAGTLNVWGILSIIPYHTNYHSSLICYIEPAKQLH